MDYLSAQCETSFRGGGLNGGREASSPASELGGQALAAGLCAQWNQKQSEQEGNRSHRHGGSERAKMPDALAYQKRNASPAKSRERGGKGEGTGAALCGILLGQPKRVDGEVGAA